MMRALERPEVASPSVGISDDAWLAVVSLHGDAEDGDDPEDLDDLDAVADLGQD
jgi:hypothetical protein